MSTAPAAPETLGPRITFDGGASSHDPDLYDFDEVAPGIDGIEAVTDRDVQKYREQGYLIVHNLLSPQEVADAKQALSDLIAARRNAKYELMFEAAVRGRVEQLDPEARERAVRKVFQFHGADARLDAIIYSKTMLSLIDRLGATSPKLFQSMALLKGPDGREKPWHQDHAYFNTPVQNRLVGVWIALDPATADNGCMRLIPGKHHEPFLHFQRRDWQICDTDIRQVRDRRVAAVLQPGGALFFDSLLPHGTPTNVTNQRRRALQFHYAPSDAGTLTTEQRLAIFGSEGKDVTC